MSALPRPLPRRDDDRTAWLLAQVFGLRAEKKLWREAAEREQRERKAEASWHRAASAWIAVISFSAGVVVAFVLLAWIGGMG